MVVAKRPRKDLIHNNEFVDKVYRILEMICEARGPRHRHNAPLTRPAGVSIDDLESKIAAQHREKNRPSEGRSSRSYNQSQSPRGT